jgi:hypothetical protein
MHLVRLAIGIDLISAIDACGYTEELMRHPKYSEYEFLTEKEANAFTKGIDAVSSICNQYVDTQVCDLGISLASEEEMDEEEVYELSSKII